MLNDKRARAGMGLALALVSNLLLFTSTPTLRLIGWLMLCCLLPGYLLLNGLLPTRPSDTQLRLDHLVLSVAFSMALSIFGVLNLQWLPGEMTLVRILLGNNLFVVIGAIIGLVGPLKPAADADRRDRALSWWVFIILTLILLLGGTLRAVNLGYSEFQDDEVDIVQVSLQAIQGDKSAVLSDVRGPARTMLAASFFLATDRVGEVGVRGPVAFASMVCVLAVFCLGRRLFNPTVGLLAAAIMAVEGITLGYGRIVQQESLVNLMAAAAVLCFLLANRVVERATAEKYRVLGLFLFAIGLLAHYEIALIAPVVLGLWIMGEGRAFFYRSWRTIAIGVALFSVVLGSFYVPFFFNPAFGETYRHYSSDILGSGLADNIATFVSAATFYNSVYFIILLFLLSVFAYSDALARVRWLAWIYGLGSLALWSASLVFPGQFKPWGLLWFGSLTVLVLALEPAQSHGSEIDPSVPTAHARKMFKVTFAWLMAYFIPYLFIVGLPRMHYYTFAVPGALVAAYGLFALWDRLKDKMLRTALVVVLTTCYILAAYHDIVLFVSHSPEWAMTQPERPIPLHPPLHAVRLGEMFGFPQKSGWQSVAGLYRQGILRGPYETNELHQKVDWYLQRLIREPGQNRYYLVAESPHRLQAGPSPEPFVPEDYQLIGTITVAGEPKLRIFQRKDQGLITPTGVITYTNERFEVDLDGGRPLDTYRLWWDYQADAQFYQEVARYLEVAAQPEDGVVLSHPAQVELLSMYYQGGLPYYPLPASQADSEPSLEETLAEIASTHPRLFAVLWAVDAIDPAHRVERWLDANLFKADEKWFGNIRLAVYAAPYARMEEVEHDVSVRFGDGITLLKYSIQSGKLRSGQILPLRLFWRMTSPVDESYKVFVHVLDAQGRIVAQRDSEPEGGSHPTNVWSVGEEVVDNQGVLLPEDLPTGQYQIAVGMYDPMSGARLAAVDALGKSVPDNRVLLGVTVIELP